MDNVIPFPRRPVATPALPTLQIEDLRGHPEVREHGHLMLSEQPDGFWNVILFWSPPDTFCAKRMREIGRVENDRIARTVARMVRDRLKLPPGEPLVCTIGGGDAA